MPLGDRIRRLFAPSRRLPSGAARPPRTRGPAGTAAVTVRVDDSAGWTSHNYAPGDRTWPELYTDLEDTLEAWRKNFMIRRIVNLTRSYAVGSGIEIGSSDEQVAAFLKDFWNHPKNRVDRRLGAICDQLTRDGELFPVLFTNPVDGMSYLRFKTARQIRDVKTSLNDYEHELEYIETVDGANDRRWISPNHALAWEPPAAGQAPPPLMLHWSVNRPLDGTRGESDLIPVLPWALRYSEWLKDRVRLNRQRTRAGMLDIGLADDTQVETKKQQMRALNPVEAGIYVHGPGEEVNMHSLRIEADDAEDDGKVLRLAIATGANLGLHYLGEGENANYATAKEMGEPTARFYADRQQDIIWMLEDLAATAYRRYCLITGRPFPENLDYQVTVAEVARADNESLAQAALGMVRALVLASNQGWIDDETALTLALKFAGETVTAEALHEILANAPDRVEPNSPPSDDSEGTEESSKQRRSARSTEALPGTHESQGGETDAD